MNEKVKIKHWNQSKKDNCPCGDCEKKGCGAYHAECEAYQAFRAEKEKEYEERLKKYQSNYTGYRNNKRR